MKKRIIMFLLTAALMMIISCGKKVVKTNWNAEQYLNYSIELFEKGKYLKAQNELNFMSIQYSGSPLMDKVRLYLAKTYFENHEYISAIPEFNRLIQEMPESPLISEAQFYIGLCYYKMSPISSLDQANSTKAIREFQLFIETFPTNEKVSEANKYIFELRKKLAVKEFDAAKLYKKNKNFTASIVYFQSIIDNYYDLEMAEESLFRKGESQMELDKYIESQETFNQYINKYPKGKYIKEAKNNVENIQDILNSKKESKENEK